MMQKLFFVVVGVCVFGAAGIAQGQIDSFGVVGDSLTDEYQFADNGDHSAGRNWLEQLATCKNMNFGAFSEISRAYPQNQGYEYNWAKAGATTGDLIAQGQHTGLAGQISAGIVDLAVCWIGENDFTREDNIQAICEAPDDSVWQGKVIDAVNNLNYIVNYILTSDPDINLVLVTIPEIELNPHVRATLTDTTLRQRLSDAIASYNDQLKNDIAAGNSRIAVADVYQLSLNVLDLYNAGQNLVVGGYEVDLNKVGNTPDCIILSDDIHPGTITQGLMANVIVDAMNTFGAGVERMSEPQILANAGVPEPATLCILACGGLLCLRRRI